MLLFVDDILTWRDAILALDDFQYKELFLGSVDD